MKYSRSLVVAGITLALMAGPAIAKKANDENSVYAWGRWAVLAPAAGGVHVALLPLSTQGAPRNSSNTANIVVPPTPVPSGPCVAGATCSFASKNLNPGAEVNFSTGSGQPYNYAVTQLNSSTLPVAPIPGGTGQNTLYAATANGYFVLPYGANADVVYGEWRNGQYQGSNFVPGIAPSSQTLVGGNNFHGQSGYFVTGTTTAQSVLNGLQQVNTQAVYSGNMLNTGTPVVINVNFGSGTWSGSWNHSTGAVTASGSQITGFTASGAVSGASIVSQTLSPGLNGTVQGAFFGNNAGTVGGTVDVHNASASDTGVFVTTR